MRSIVNKTEPFQPAFFTSYLLQRRICTHLLRCARSASSGKIGTATFFHLQGKNSLPYLKKVAVPVFPALTSRALYLQASSPFREDTW